MELEMTFLYNFNTDYRNSIGVRICDIQMHKLQPLNGLNVQTIAKECLKQTIIAFPIESLSSSLRT